MCVTGLFGGLFAHNFDDSGFFGFGLVFVFFYLR